MNAALLENLGLGRAVVPVLIARAPDLRLDTRQGRMARVGMP